MSTKYRLILEHVACVPKAHHFVIIIKRTKWIYKLNSWKSNDQMIESIGPQRKAVLPTAERGCREDDATGVHSNGWSGLSEVRSNLPQTSRPLHQHPRQGPRLRRAEELAWARRTRHRRHRRRAYPWSWRSWCPGYGYSHRQAFVVHRTCWYQAAPVLAYHPRCWH